MAISIRGGAPSVGTNTGSTATVSVTSPAAQVGDVLLIIHSNDFYALANMPTPTVSPGSPTVTPVPNGTADGGTNLAHKKAYTAVVTTAGAQTVSVTETGSHDEEKSLVVYVLAGADTTTPVDDAAGASGTAAASHPAPSVSPTSGDALLVCAVNSGGGSSVASYTTPGSMTEQYEIHVGGLSGVGATEQLASSGATGTRTFTGAASTPWAAVSVAIKAAAGGGGATIAPDGITIPAALGSPALAWSGTAGPDGVSVPVALGAPIVGAASIDPDGIAVPVTLGAPALAWSGSVAPDGASVPVALGSPVVGADGLAPDGIALPVALGLPSLVWSAAVGPDGLSVPVQVATFVDPITGGVMRPAARSAATARPVARSAATARPAGRPRPSMTAGG